jgi:hypothetical protein
MWWCRRKEFLLIVETVRRLPFGIRRSEGAVGVRRSQKARKLALGRAGFGRRARRDPNTKRPPNGER